MLKAIFHVSYGVCKTFNAKYLHTTKLKTFPFLVTFALKHVLVTVFFGVLPATKKQDCLFNFPGDETTDRGEEGWASYLGRRGTALQCGILVSRLVSQLHDSQPGQSIVCTQSRGTARQSHKTPNTESTRALQQN